MTERVAILSMRCSLVVLLIATGSSIAASASDLPSTTSAGSRVPSERPTQTGTSVEPSLLGEVQNARAVMLTAPAAIPVKVRRYALKTLARYDVDGSGQLEADEWPALAQQGKNLDINGDQLISLQEWTARIAGYGRGRRIRLMSHTRDDTAIAGRVVQARAMEPHSDSGVLLAAHIHDSDTTALSADQGHRQHDRSRRGLKYYVPDSQLPQGLPEWFLQRDRDGDGQLTLAEFAPRAGHVDASRFAGLDGNGDGLITAKECVQSAQSEKAAEAVSPASSAR